nr:MATE family efflux transporter [uncultured Tyzzerella sp.]
MNENFKLSQILKLVTPTIFMMCFLSLYTMVDGAFVSRFVNTTALSAINIAFPYVNFLLGISIMLSSGGCALVMKKLGEGKEEEAKKDFTLILTFAFIVSIVISILSLIFLEQLLNIFQAKGNLYEYAKDYLICIILFAMPTILKSIVEQFLIATNRPNIALILTLFGGILNIVLDYVFIVPLGLGIKGAAIATGLGYAVPAIIGLMFFIKKTNILHFTKPSKNLKVILNSCYNGSSEMVTQISNGIVTFLFNVAMLKYIGEDGVASITIVLYVQFLVTAVFLGYSMGIAPKISYFYGNKDEEMTKGIIYFSLKFIGIVSIIIYIVILLFAPILVGFFAKEGTEVFNITIGGLKLFSLSFLIVGFNIFASAMFTAFSNGKISAIISFLKTLIFESGFIILLPLILNIYGIWLAVPIAEGFALFVSFYFFKKYKTIYKY